MKCCSWFEYQEEEEWDEILKKFDCLIVGSHYEIDDRTLFFGTQFSRLNKDILQFEVIYPSATSSDKDLVYKLNNDQVLNNDLERVINSYGKENHMLLVDISTFDLPELYHFLRYCDQVVSKASLAYIEPKEYSKEETSGNEYCLSKDGNGLDYLSSCDILPFYSKRYLISIGYESHRLSGFLSSDEIKTVDKKSVIIGVPPFKVGWEHEAIKNNYQTLDKYDTGVYIAPADDPVQTYLKTFEIYQSLNPKIQEKLVLIPIGPKPQALGMIWFALSKNTDLIAEVGMQYDFVKKLQKRTIGVSKIHLWDFEFK